MYKLEYKTNWSAPFHTAGVSKVKRNLLDYASVFNGSWYEWRIVNSKGQTVAQKPQRGCYV